MSAKFDFSGHAVLVTGGTTGIGRAIANAFSIAGADVSITGTRPNASDYEDDLTEFSYAQVLLEDSDSVDQFIAETDRVDVLVNNAGAAIDPPLSLTPSGFEKNLAINLSSVFRICQGLHDHLLTKPGNIINIASIYSYFGSAWGPGYGASKSAIVSLTKSLGVLYADDGVRVNAIAPGWIETNMSADSRNAEEPNRRIIERTPMGRWGKPHELAGTALYLASDDLAGFVTGATIAVDGGWSVA